MSLLDTYWPNKDVEWFFAGIVVTLLVEAIVVLYLEYLKWFPKKEEKKNDSESA